MNEARPRQARPCGVPIELSLLFARSGGDWFKEPILMPPHGNSQNGDRNVCSKGARALREVKGRPTLARNLVRACACTEFI